MFTEPSQNLKYIFIIAVRLKIGFIRGVLLMVEMLGGRAGLAVDTGVDRMLLYGMKVARVSSTAAFLALAVVSCRIS